MSDGGGLQRFLGLRDLILCAFLNHVQTHKFTTYNYSDNETAELNLGWQTKGSEWIFVVEKVNLNYDESVQNWIARLMSTKSDFFYILLIQKTNTAVATLFFYDSMHQLSQNFHPYLSRVI